MEKEEPLLPMSDISYCWLVQGHVVQIETALRAANFSIMKNVPEIYENKIFTRLI